MKQTTTTTSSQVARRELQTRGGYLYDLIFDEASYCMHIEVCGIRIFSVDSLAVSESVISAMVDAYFV